MSEETNGQENGGGSVPEIELIIKVRSRKVVRKSERVAVGRKGRLSPVVGLSLVLNGLGAEDKLWWWHGGSVQCLSVTVVLPGGFEGSVMSAWY